MDRVEKDRENGWGDRMKKKRQKLRGGKIGQAE